MVEDRCELQAGISARATEELTGRLSEAGQQVEAASERGGLELGRIVLSRCYSRRRLYTDFVSSPCNAMLGQCSEATLRRAIRNSRASAKHELSPAFQDVAATTRRPCSVELEGTTTHGWELQRGAH